MENSSFYKQNTLPELITPQDTLPLPENIGPYKIEALLGKGGMSLLYLGVDPASKKTVAVKVLSPSYVNHPEAVGHFLTEAKVIGLSNHPNIVKLYAQGEWEQGLYMAMEFIRGISLKQFIQQHSLSLKRALEIVLQVAYALMHLHSHNVIHRDLKPGNILITEEGEVKVIDFGIAQLHEESKPKAVLSKVLGTPDYMSPEQKQDPSSVTFATDIYALGIILYELVMGKLSYGTIQLHALPKALRKIVEKAIAVTPSERYPSSAAFIQEISLYLESKELERERPDSDQVKEIKERLERASFSLSPFTLPIWPQVEIGVAKEKSANPSPLFYDFFRLPNHTFLILVAASASEEIESALSLNFLRGLVQMQIDTLMRNFPTSFELSDFLSPLNHILREDRMKEAFALTALLLDPFKDTLIYASCGLGSLLHIPEGKSVPTLFAPQNPLLGQSAAPEFSETDDNWNTGDALLLHTFTLPSETKREKLQHLESSLSQAASEYLLLSANRQAEALLKALPSSAEAAEVLFPKLVISIQRIV